MTNLKQSAVRGVAWSTIENWAGQGMSFLVFLVLARILGPADFGLVALAGVYVTLVQMIVRQGFAEAVVQVRELEEAHLDAAFWTNLVLSLALGALTLFAAPFVAVLLGHAQLAPVVRWMALLFPLGALSAVPQAVLTRRMEFKSLAVRTFISFGCSGVTGVVMALMGYGVWSLVGQQIANSAVNVIVLWSAGGWRPRFRFSLPHLRQLWGFGVHVFGMNMLDLVNKRSDQYIVGLHLGSVVLGFYSIANRVYQLMMGLGVSSFNRVAAGAFSRLQHDPPRLAAALVKSVEMTTCVALPAFLGFAALAPEVITLFFGPHWLPAVPSMQLLMFLGVLHSVQFFHGQILRAMGKPGWHLQLLALHTAVNLAIYLIFIRYGLETMVTAYVIRAYALAPIEVWLIRRLIPLPVWPYLARLLPQTVCSLIMGGLIVLLKSALHDRLPGASVLALGILVGAAIYALSLALLRPSLFRELTALLSTLRRSPSAQPAPAAS